VASAAVRLDLADVVLDAPVPRPGKVMAIGLSYADHVAEAGQAVPAGAGVDQQSRHGGRRSARPGAGRHGVRLRGPRGRCSPGPQRGSAPPRTHRGFLRDGDVVRVEVDGLGAIENTVRVTS
jgi:2-keto-4-pentenoate hydratase/2-oxohepta-3-ene-1,7-dioic acid hydratase in catechol pathway